jgi:hypothetical protein
MLYVYLGVSCIAFVELFIALDILHESRSLISRTHEAMRVVMSTELDDDQKEVFMRRASLEMFKSTGLFLGKFLVIAAALYAVYVAAVAVFPDLRPQILASLASPASMVGLTAFAFVYVWARNVIFR